MHFKRVITAVFAIGFGGYLLLIAAALITEKFILGTAGEIPLRVLLGQGRIYTDRIPVIISVDGISLKNAVAFRNPNIKTEEYRIYVPSEDKKNPYSVITFAPSAKMVGFSANTRPNGSLLIAGQILLQSNMAIKFVPIDLSIKSGMALPHFTQIDQDTYSFVAQPKYDGSKCSAKTNTLDLRWCPGTRWHPLPFGKWNIQLQRD